jgi:catechol 2,3-dioxygenase-like lactoylglutathione lyase family enzyme
MATPMTNGFDHIAVLTADLDRLVDFYQRIFGARVLHTIEVRPDHPRMAAIEVGEGAHLGAFEVTPEQIVGDRARAGRRGPIDHFGLSVDSVERLEALRDRLVEAGASPGEITDFGTALSVFFRDPDGAELEVCYHKPDRETPGAAASITPA